MCFRSCSTHSPAPIHVMIEKVVRMFAVRKGTVLTRLDGVLLIQIRVSEYELCN